MKRWLAFGIILAAAVTISFYAGERYERREWHWALSKCATDILRGVKR